MAVARSCRVGGVLPGCRLTTGRAGAMLAAVTGTADHCGATVWRGTGWRRSMRDRVCAHGRSLSPRGGVWNVAEARGGVLPADLEGRESITAGVPDRRGIAAWSLREGYPKMPSGTALQELAAKHQISLTSVHASAFDLRRLAGALRPPRVVPVHSDAGGRFCGFFPGAGRHADGCCRQAGSR
jgi:hypothetical protein